MRQERERESYLEKKKNEVAFEIKNGVQNHFGITNLFWGEARKIIFIKEIRGIPIAPLYF